MDVIWLEAARIIDGSKAEVGRKKPQISKARCQSVVCDSQPTANGCFSSEVQLVLTPSRRRTQGRRTACAFNGQAEHQKGLIQSGLMELGRLAQNIGNDVISALELFQYGCGWVHIILGLEDCSGSIWSFIL